MPWYGNQLYYKIKTLRRFVTCERYCQTGIGINCGANADNKKLLSFIPLRPADIYNYTKATYAGKLQNVRSNSSALQSGNNEVTARAETPKGAA